MDKYYKDTKDCPMCAETVKAKAKICRFCKHEFEFETEETETVEGDEAAAGEAAGARREEPGSSWFSRQLLPSLLLPASQPAAR